MRNSVTSDTVYNKGSIWAAISLDQNIGMKRLDTSYNSTESSNKSTGSHLVLNIGQKKSS